MSKKDIRVYGLYPFGLSKRSGQILLETSEPLSLVDFTRRFAKTMIKCRVFKSNIDMDKINGFYSNHPLFGGGYSIDVNAIPDESISQLSKMSKALDIHLNGGYLLSNGVFDIFRRYDHRKLFKMNTLDPEKDFRFVLSLGYLLGSEKRRLAEILFGNRIDI